MNLEPFKLERILSEWQNVVDIDLSSSGVNALGLQELISPDELMALYHSIKLRYVQTNGPLSLRTAICRRYPGANVNNILVTNGSSEALMLIMWKYSVPGAELVEITPTYSLVGGLARSLGMTVRGVQLVEAQGWKPDLEQLEDIVTAKTALIYVSNPNNPTGSILSPAEMSAIIRVAERVGAWVVADEIYHGAELDGRRTPSFWGMYDKLLATASLSKSYGLAGLRLGWLAGPPDAVAGLWHYHDYTTTTTTALSVELAQRALEPEREALILAHNRAFSQQQYQLLSAWLAHHPDRLHAVPTCIGGLAFVGYTMPTASETLAHQLIRDCGVLLAPGGCFGVERHFRIGYSVPHLADGLERLSAAFTRDDRS